MGEKVRGESDRGTDEREVCPDRGPGALEDVMNGTVEMDWCADRWSGEGRCGMV